MSFILELRDEPLATEDPVSKGDGRHLGREGPDDTGVYAHVKDGAITGYSARRKHQGLKTAHLSEMIDGEMRSVTFLVYTSSENKEVGYLI